MDTEQQVETEQQQQQDNSPDPQGSDTVEIHEASREDLKQYREQALAQEAGTVSGEDTTVAQPPQKPVVQPIAPSTEAPEGVSPQQPTEKPQFTQEDYQRQVAANEKLLQENKQKELFIQKRNTEYGEVKKQLNATREQLLATKKALEERFDETFHSSPAQALEDRDRMRGIEGQIENIDQQESRLQRIFDGERLYMAHVGDKATIDDLAETLRADGVDEQYINHLRNNPFDFTTPEALVQLGKRAVERKELIQHKSDLQILAKYAKNLKEENERLVGKPGKVINQVQRHLNQAPPLTAANGVSSDDSRVFKDPSLMSRDELREFLRRAG